MRALALVWLGCLAPAMAAGGLTVYRSVDDNGVVSFSDQPPVAGPADVIHLDSPPVAEDPDLEARLEAMRETTDRMASDRREREKHRADLRAVRTKGEPAPPVAAQATPWSGAIWPVYRSFRPRPPLRPHRPLRPHPDARPSPLPATPPPGWSVMQAGNAQLMRPVVSTRR